MKNLFPVLCCLALAACCFILSGCGGGGGSADLSESEYVGTWVAQTIDAFGEEETTEEIGNVLEGGMTLTVNGDGTAVADFGDGEPLNVTWTETGDGFKTKGDMKLTFTKEDGGITTSIVGAHIHLVRQ